MEAILEKTISAYEYLQIDSQSTIKNEYLFDTIIPMPNVSQKHNFIVHNLMGLLWFFRKGRAIEVYPSEMRTHIPLRNAYVYPDATVVMGKSVLKQGEFDNLTNPTLIVEVLSPSTELYDRTDKMTAYQTIESLQEYVLIAQNKRCIETYMKQANNTWIYKIYMEPDAVVRFESIGFECTMNDIYDNIDMNI
jgi:Uma2 family endonuclease